MKRRELLGGLGAGTVSPAINFNSRTEEEIGRIRFVWADLTYEIQSEHDADLQGFHIDKPPWFHIRNRRLYLTPFATDKITTRLRNEESVINFGGLKSFSNSSSKKEPMSILPIQSGGRGQVSFGVSLEDTIETPGLSVQKAGSKSIRLYALDEAVTLDSNEDVTLTGTPIDVEVQRTDSPTPATITVRPSLSVSNEGILTATIPK